MAAEVVRIATRMAAVIMIEAVAAMAENVMAGVIEMVGVIETAMAEITTVGTMVAEIVTGIIGIVLALAAEIATVTTETTAADAIIVMSFTIIIIITGIETGIEVLPVVGGSVRLSINR
jgi:hypothetical protein